MSLQPALSLFSRLAGRRGVVREPEPADMGTAFGMEQWLDEADEAPAPAPAQTRMRRSWWRRWMRRASAT